jgi:hypothetical protein
MLDADSILPLALLVGYDSELNFAAGVPNFLEFRQSRLSSV